MSYEISFGNNVLQIVLKGRVTSSDFHGLLTEAVHYESAAEIPHRITDMRPITQMDVSFPDIMNFAGQRRGLKFPNSFKSAIIANRDLQLGYARVFQTLNDNPQIVIKIFPDREAANEWILKTETTAKQS